MPPRVRSCRSQALWWFAIGQDSEERETLRQRFHVDVWVPAEVTDSGSRRVGLWSTTAHPPSTVVRDQNREVTCAGTTGPLTSAPPHGTSSAPLSRNRSDAEPQPTPGSERLNQLEVLERRAARDH